MCVCLVWIIIVFCKVFHSLSTFKLAKKFLALMYHLEVKVDRTL